MPITTRPCRPATSKTRLSGRPRASSNSSIRSSAGSILASPKSVAAQTDFSCPASSSTRLNGVPVAGRPRTVRNSRRPDSTNVNAASAWPVRLVAAQTPPGQLITAPTNCAGNPNGIGWGIAAASCR